MHAVPKAVAVASITLALGLQPALAVASAPESPAPRTQVTAPFDPICPLCFIREFLESGSAHP
ncbi:hypothetical protein [Nocardia wallacei]|uniref:hypothetical protein n=1 Tax=Nocardia TaxID=1817 RepID=UPI002456FA2B|nr:hypothetical protein [Nocardia wallacei]